MLAKSIAGILGYKEVIFMAEAHKFGKSGLVGAVEVFPDLKWRKTDAGRDLIWDEKVGGWVEVKDGQYVVKVGSRYEVANEEPEKAKKAEAPKTATKKAKAEEAVAVVKAVEAGEDPAVAVTSNTKEEETAEQKLAKAEAEKAPVAVDEKAKSEDDK